MAVLGFNGSFPIVAMLLIITGTMPQCKPNITKICQEAAMTAPAIIGLKAMIAVKIEAIPFPT